MSVDVGMSVGDFQQMFQLLPNLEDLQLMDIPYLAIVMSIIKSISSHFKKLKRLTLGSTGLCRLDLVDLGLLSSLEGLRLSNFRLKGMHHLGCHLLGLLKLEFKRSYIPEQDLHWPSYILQLPALKELTVQH